MKIGIMTFWWSEDNYGQQLQAFALQKYLRELGHDPFLIRYDPRNDSLTKTYLRILKVFNPKLLYRFIFNKGKVFLNFRNNVKNPRGFQNFRTTYLKQSDKIYYHFNDLQNDPPEADIYICGSDQIWNFPDNFNAYKNLIRAYFLNFGKPETKRIAYAASFGRASLSQELIQYITPFLAKFDYISVRESTGIQICKQAGIEKVDCVLDPTMLIPVKNYLDFSPPVIPEKKYCFIYLLGNKCDVPMKQIQDYANDHELSLVYTASQFKIDRSTKIYPTIPEWISLIANSDSVITNSFHGMIFSILFNKKFVVLPLKGVVGEGMNGRFVSLFEKLNIKDKIFNGSLTLALEKELDWVQIKSKIVNEINLSEFITHFN